MEIDTHKISEILKIEISFLVFKLSYLNQFMSDLNKFGLKMQVREQKAFVLCSVKRFAFFESPGITSQHYLHINILSCMAMAQNHFKEFFKKPEDERSFGFHLLEVVRS